jgi:hypothetical protein
LFAGPGGVPFIGPETGKVKKDGLSVLKNPWGSTRYVWAVDGRIVGVLQIVHRPGDYARVANVVVKPDFQRQGIATKLFRRAEKDFGVVLHAEPAARSPLGQSWISSLQRKGSGLKAYVPPVYWRFQSKETSLRGFYWGGFVRLFGVRGVPQLIGAITDVKAQQSDYDLGKMAYGASYIRHEPEYDGAYVVDLLRDKSAVFFWIDADDGHIAIDDDFDEDDAKRVREYLQRVISIFPLKEGSRLRAVRSGPSVEVVEISVVGKVPRWVLFDPVRVGLYSAAPSRSDAPAFLWKDHQGARSAADKVRMVPGWDFWSKEEIYAHPEGDHFPPRLWLEKAMAFRAKSGSLLKAVVPSPFWADVLDSNFSEVGGNTEIIPAFLEAVRRRKIIVLLGIGRGMIARRAVGLLGRPSPGEQERLRELYEQMKISPAPLRPFRAPHHSSSTAGLIRQGGEYDLSCSGVLFLDAITEFKRSDLEAIARVHSGPVLHPPLIILGHDPHVQGFEDRYLKALDVFRSRGLDLEVFNLKEPDPSSSTPWPHWPSTRVLAGRIGSALRSAVRQVSRQQEEKPKFKVGHKVRILRDGRKNQFGIIEEVKPGFWYYVYKSGEFGTWVHESELELAKVK